MAERKQEITERLQREFEICDKHILCLGEALAGLGVDLPLGIYDNLKKVYFAGKR